MTAHPSVSALPTPIASDAPVSMKSPAADTTTAVTTRESGSRRVTSTSIIGVNTTNNPVMNAESDVVVRWRPAFWNQ